MVLDRKLIYIVGNARSGTTMMAELLSKDKKVFTFGEIHFFEQLWNGNINVLDDAESLDLFKHLFAIQRDGYLAQHTYKDYEIDAKLLLDTISKKNVEKKPLNLYYEFLIYETEQNSKSIPCEQTPKNLLYLDDILKNYSEAYCINMIRDPRDILLSQKNRWKLKFLGLNEIPYLELIRNFINYHPITTSSIWKSSVLSYEKCTDNERVVSIYFEELLNEPEKILKYICSYLEIPYNSNMLKVKQIHSSNENNDPKKVGIDKKKAGRWNQGGLNKTELFICQRILKKEMERHGYAIETISPNYLMLFVYYLYFPLHIVLVLLFNFNRAKSLTSAIKKRLT